ncbi:dTMP kinase [Pelagibius litoralis]|uniref:Thymidylate kinase n=1 Tax=Pelagibius litoralis TaxID=374515 RepID=A0A967C3G2_9PROT|nr:dTMP kinase [Pelagibius litoralis]NIA67749.1 dTMP kinase [Pelagibius litoralis]
MSDPAKAAGTPRGRFITLEGGEGAGKSTQQKKLADWLSQKGVGVIETREPGGSPGAEQIRNLLVTGAAGRWDAMTETLLHFAARRDHVVATIEPALARGAWVVCDRFADSTMAYQGFGHQLGRPPVETLARLVLGGLKPDLTLMLDLPVEEGLDRARARNGGATEAEDRYESMEIAFHERLREGFHEIAAREPERCLLVDASGTAEVVSEKIQQAVVERFGAFLL